MSERDPMRPSGRELRELLAPHPIGPFLAEHWGQKPLYIPGSPKKFDRLKFDLRALERAIRDEDHRRDRFHVRWVGADNRAKPKPADLARYSIRDGDLTVCADWINDRFDRLAAFCAGIKAALSLPGSVFMTCYASPHGHGFGTHWDCQAVFVLQIEGSKRWRFSAEPAVEWPPALLPNAGVVEEMVDRYPWLQVGFPDDCAERTFLEETLTPGDVLFLPAGTWHRASAIGCSVALTMACPPMTAADFVDDVIRGHLSHAVDWRRNVPPVPMESTPPDRLPREVKRFFAARLAELRSHVRSLRAEDLFETWTHHVAAFDTPLRMEDRPRAPELEAADTLRLATDFPVRYVARRGEGSVSVYFLDHRIDLAYEALPLVKGILKRPVFKARSAARWLGKKSRWNDVKPVLQELVQSGILHIGRKGVSKRKTRPPTKQ